MPARLRANRDGPAVQGGLHPQNDDAHSGKPAGTGNARPRPAIFTPKCPGRLPGFESPAESGARARASGPPSAAGSRSVRAGDSGPLPSGPLPSPGPTSSVPPWSGHRKRDCDHDCQGRAGGGPGTASELVTVEARLSLADSLRLVSSSPPAASLRPGSLTSQARRHHDHQVAAEATQ